MITHVKGAATAGHSGEIMEQMVYKIGEVSARLGLVDKNSNTLRSWAEEFGPYLSALANPPAGQPRRFTERDMQVLAAIRDYRANHLNYDEIRERLGAGEHTVTLHASDSLPATQSEDGGGTAPAQPSQAVVSPAQMERMLAPLVASVEEWRRLADEYRTRLEGREARIEILERRVEDLYTRLDTAQAAPPAAAATTTHHDNVDEQREAAPPALNGSEDPRDASVTVEQPGAVSEEQDDPLFPLPVVVQPHDADATRAAPPRPPAAWTQPAEPTRRRWWRPWA